MVPQVSFVKIFGFLVSSVSTLSPCAEPTFSSRGVKNKKHCKTNMVLTQEQKERIKKNRERALEIQKRRREEREAQGPPVNGKSNGKAEPPRKKAALGEAGEVGTGGEKADGDNGDTQETLELEEFEVGASKYVTRKEAMKIYLLPEGTLAICKFEEKPNPRNNKFQPMKLYDRAEIRRLSRERFGGLEGVIEERRKRQEKRFQKDLDETKDLFRK